jgi:uncharacterized tellurite resistance protein B-like protein
MKFENLLNNFDMGLCADQLQREALVDLVVLFIEIDGVVDESEMNYLQKWLNNLTWTSNTPTETYLTDISVKCKNAIANAQIEDFIRHRTQHLLDEPVRQQAINLAEEVALVDGVLHHKEKAAINFLKQCLS